MNSFFSKQMFGHFGIVFFKPLFNHICIMRRGNRQLKRCPERPIISPIFKKKERNAKHNPSNNNNKKYSEERNTVCNTIKIIIGYIMKNKKTQKNVVYTKEIYSKRHAFIIFSLEHFFQWTRMIFSFTIHRFFINYSKRENDAAHNYAQTTTIFILRNVKVYHYINYPNRPRMDSIIIFVKQIFNHVLIVFGIDHNNKNLTIRFIDRVSYLDPYEKVKGFDELRRSLYNLKSIVPEVI